MTTDTETLESICRELAELTTPVSPTDYRPLPWDAPDPRFDALRGEHEHTPCVVCDESWTVESPGYCIRTDLGSIVRAAAACGSTALAEVLSAVNNAFWWPAKEDFQLRERRAPELAAARALKEAVDAVG